MSGFAGLGAGDAEMPLAGPDPSYREVVANHLKKVLKNYSLYDSFEISDPRWGALDQGLGLAHVSALSRSRSRA